MFSEWPTEFSEYSRDKSKNFLLKKFLKILLPGHAHQQQMKEIRLPIKNILLGYLWAWPSSNIFQTF